MKELKELTDQELISLAFAALRVGPNEVFAEVTERLQFLVAIHANEILTLEEVESGLHGEVYTIRSLIKHLQRRNR